MALTVGDKLGHYRLLEPIGSGGMGDVWRAQDLSLGREIALKILPGDLAADPVRRSRFRQEARTLAALSHPHIVTIHAVEESDGRHFFTMELIQGQTLADLIPATGWPAARVLELGIPMADAIVAAHAGGLVHRDIKPRNIMVSDGGILKVLDFGLAASAGAPRTGGDSAATTRSFVPGPGGGTPAYMSPEQVRGDPTDTRTDLFSLGVVLYEMSCGQRPFHGRTSADRAAAILKDTPQALTDLLAEYPRQLWRVLRRCLEKLPDKRLQTALDLRNELQDLARERALAGEEGARSIAVLPFSDLSRTGDQAYFCAGIAEEILNALTGLAGMRVVSRLSSFRFKDSDLESREIGRRLGVRTLLEGSVGKAGDRLRITVRLTDVEEGLQLWSERYERGLPDVFAIQDEIAGRVVEALEVSLRPGERDGLTTIRTRDVAAYDCYLRGRDFFFQYRLQGIADALQLFHQAIRRDPGYALAHAGVSDCCAYLFMYGGRQEAQRDQALTASARALELAPDLARAHTSHGVALSLLERHQEAEAAFEQALHLDPGLFEAYYFYARDCFIQGRIDRAIELYEQAAAARPDDYQSLLLVAQSYDDTGRPEEAVRARRRGLQVAEEHLQLNPDDTRALYLGANALVALGEKERGLRWTRRALARDPDDSMLLYNVACIQSLAGELDEAMATMERAVANGLTQREWLARDSNLDPLRDRERFQAIMASLAT